MGTGSTWKSPQFEQDGKFFLNFSEWKGPRQTIFFAESKDLVHWMRLGDEFEFVQDEHWYEKDGRWDCIWTLPRPGGGLYGYWTANALAGGEFGFGESLDGLHWDALPPPQVVGAGIEGGRRHGEVGAVEKIGAKYYMLFGHYPFMVTLIADQPTGPFHRARKNYQVLAGNTYFARFLPTPHGFLVNHHAIARDGQVSFAPLKAAALDAEGTLRLGWWQGNEKSKHQAIALKSPAPPGGDQPAMAMIQPEFDPRAGLILEGTLKLPATKEAKPVGLFVAQRDGAGTAILVQAGGITEFGPMRADGSGFKAEQRVDREWAFCEAARFRLLLKGSLIEFYLDDLLMQCYSLPHEAAGHIGLLPVGDPAAITALKAWQAGELQPAAQGEDAWMRRPQDDVYSRAAPGTYNVPPELKNFRILSSTPLQISNAEEAGYDIKKWQGDSSRIIYHDGKYHVWMMERIEWSFGSDSTPEKEKIQ